MKTTLKILPLVFGVILFFTQCEKEAFDGIDNMVPKNIHADAQCFDEQELWAGAAQNDLTKGTLVGKVKWSVTDNILAVEYIVDEPWVATKYHLWVGKRENEPNGAFLNIGQAAPGQFPYSGTSNIFSINLDNLDFNPGDPVYISAHAEVENNEVADFDAIDLPSIVDFEILKFPGNTSYFDIEIHDGGFLTGEYNAWCIDPNLGIGPDVSDTDPFYTADVYLSLGDFPDYFNNMDFGKINWILNFAAPLVPETYSMGDVQTAIWKIIFGDEYDVVGVEPDSDPDNVQEIIQNANSNFVPGCGQLVGVLLHTENNFQPIIIPIEVPCKTVEETAWAFGGHTFIENGISTKWGWIFEIEYCLQ